jgi:hypothetical protein
LRKISFKKDKRRCRGTGKRISRRSTFFRANVNARSKTEVVAPSKKINPNQFKTNQKYKWKTITIKTQILKNKKK